MNIIFIACSKKKKDHPCAAHEMYSPSALFSKSFNYAKTIPDSTIYILSAKYGLLDINQKIEPYNVTLIAMSEYRKKEWAYKVYKTIKSVINNADRLIFLTGRQYSKYLIFALKRDGYAIEEPLKNLPLGNRLKYLNNETKRGKL